MVESDRRAWSASSRPPHRRMRWAVGIAYAVALCALLFWPFHVDGERGFIRLGWLRDLLSTIGTSGSLAYEALEFLGNVALIVPLGFIWSAWGRESWSAGARLGSAALLGATVSSLAELVQFVAIPGRTPDARDILAGAIGCTLGAVLAQVARRPTPTAVALDERRPNAG